MEDKLIEFVRENRFLYDKKHRNYKNIHLRDLKFQEHADCVNIPAEKLKARWRTLRDKFYKDLKRKPSGSGLSSPHKKWKWMDQLAFLKDVEMDNMNTHGNYDNLDIVEDIAINEDLDESFNYDFCAIPSPSNINASQSNTPLPKNTAQKRKLTAILESANEEFKKVSSLAVNAMADEPKSGIKLFFESLGVQAESASLSPIESSALQLQMSQTFHNFIINRNN